MAKPSIHERGSERIHSYIHDVNSRFKCSQEEKQTSVSTQADVDSLWFLIQEVKGLYENMSFCSFIKVALITEYQALG